MSVTLKSLMNLRDRVAVVTGATGYLGRVISETLAELGADLILVDRPGSNYDAIRLAVADRYDVAIHSRDCDLELPSDRRNLLDWIGGEVSGVNVLVNNAAFAGGENLTGWNVGYRQQTIETWRRALEVNLTAVFELCQGLTDSLARSSDGSIINIGSIYGLHGPDWGLYADTDMSNPAAYGVSKGGLLQLTKWLATTVAPRIRVNAISPGGIFRNQPEAFVHRYEARTPLRRMAVEDDFRGAVAFLASDMSAYVTGQNILVDGGFGVW